MSKSNYKYGAVSQVDDIEANGITTDEMANSERPPKLGCRNFHWRRIIGFVVSIGFIWILCSVAGSNSPITNTIHAEKLAASVKNTYSVVRNGTSFKIVQPAVSVSSKRRLNPDYPVASAEYIKNLDGNGWHYFSATAPPIETTVQFMGASIVEDILDDHIQANLVIDEYLGVYR